MKNESISQILKDKVATANLYHLIRNDFYEFERFYEATKRTHLFRYENFVEMFDEITYEEIREKNPKL